MAYGVIEKTGVMAQNVDMLNRNVKSATLLENGFIFDLLTVGTVANGESEVFVATVPTTSALMDLWMLAEDPVNITGGKYRNIDPDPRNYTLAIGDVGSAFQPRVGDLIRVSADAFSAAVTTETFFNATNASWQLVPGSSQTASVLSFKLVGTDYMSIGLGSLGTQRITAYLIECVGVA